VKVQKTDSFSADQCCDDVPQLPAIDSPAFTAAFSAMVRTCEQIFYQLGESIDQPTLQKKTRALQELRRVIIRPTRALPGLSNANVGILFDMIELNINRPIRVDLRVSGIGDTGMTSEPAWPHLCVVYRILGDLAKTFPEDAHFSDRFFGTLLGPCGSPDLNEQLAIHDFFVAYLKARPGERSKMLGRIETALKDYRGNPSVYSPHLPASMLRLAVHIIDETTPMPARAPLVFIEAIAPLLGSPYLHLFNGSMTKLAESCSESHSICAVTLIRVITRDFCHALPGNQSLIVGHLGVALRHAPLRALGLWAVPIARMIADATMSLSEGVAQAALGLWGRDGGARLLSAQKKGVIPIVFPAIQHAMRNHWSGAVRDMARSPIMIFQKVGAALVSESLREAAAAPVGTWPSTWLQLAEAAQERCDNGTFVGDTSELWKAAQFVDGDGAGPKRARKSWSLPNTGIGTGTFKDLLVGSSLSQTDMI
jgi:hypothetical protein